jgi:hypothetical protein
MTNNTSNIVSFFSKKITSKWLIGPSHSSQTTHIHSQRLLVIFIFISQKTFFFITPWRSERKSILNVKKKKKEKVFVLFSFIDNWFWKRARRMATIVQYYGRLKFIEWKWKLKKIGLEKTFKNWRLHRFGEISSSNINKSEESCNQLENQTTHYYK